MQTLFFRKQYAKSRTRTTDLAIKHVNRIQFSQYKDLEKKFRIQSEYIKELDAYVKPECSKARKRPKSHNT